MLYLMVRGFLLNRLGCRLDKEYVLADLWLLYFAPLLHTNFDSVVDSALAWLRP